MKGRYLAPRWAFAAAAILVLGGCTGSGDDQQATSTTTAANSSDDSAVALEQAYQRVITNVLPSVVEIRTSTGLGSGVVYDDKGHIVTNAHVVGEDQEFEVLTAGSPSPLKATLVGRFQPNDLAVIHVEDAKGLVPATFADSAKAHVGEIVLAMGNPLGLSATVTDGIVSALGRTVGEPASEAAPPATLPDTIQTSAAINPGNSGGALVTLDAEVVGIPTLAATNPTAGGLAPGIGFAIPSNAVRRIVDQLVADGTVTDSGRAALGVRVTTVVDSSGQPQGVGVVAVDSGSGADQAGIRAGDVIVSLDGKDTPAAQVLSAVLADLHVGDSVPVTVERDGKQVKVDITLDDLGD